MLAWLTLEGILRAVALWLFYWLAHFLLAEVILARVNLPDNTAVLRHALARHALSAFFAIYASGLGFVTLQNLGDDFLYATYPPLISHCLVAFTFFTFDIVITFQGFVAEAGLHHLSFLRRFKIFAKKQTMMLVHHLFLAFVGMPLTAFVVHDKGHLVLAVIMLHEASTPFFCAYLAMKQLKVMRGLVFTVNAVLFLTAFFVFRVCAFPYLYWRYQVWRGLPTIFHAILSVHWYCNVGSLLIAGLQYFWFYEILWRIVARARENGKDCRRSYKKLS